MASDGSRRGVTYWMGRVLARHPLIFAAIAMVVAAKSCSVLTAAKVADEIKTTEEIVKRQAEQQAEIEVARVARAEAAKTPQQRASEAAAKLAEEASLRKEKQAQEAREKAVARAGSGIEALQWWQQCAAWGKERRLSLNSPRGEALLRALKNQSLVNALDEQAVGSRESMPSVGMSHCGVLAVLGPSEGRNVSTNAFSTRVQLVYRSRSMYVYVEGPAGDHNGKVTSIQY